MVRSVNSGVSSKTLFVKNLSYSTSKESLQEHFEGAVSARIATFPDTGKARGFGYVDFDTAEAAKAAFNSMKGSNLDGRDIFIDFEKGDRDGGRGGFRGGIGGRGGGRGFGRGGFGGGRGGGRGRGGGWGRGGFGESRRGGIQEFKSTRKSFGDD